MNREVNAVQSQEMMIRNPGSQALLDHMQRSAERVETPCGGGSMVWHIWGCGPALVLLHGGAGSWRHWVRNIPLLEPHYRLLVADLPGLGESDSPPEPASVQSVATIVADGLDRILGPDAGYDLVGFSFGAVTGAEIVLLHGARARSFTIVSAGSLRLPNGRSDPVRVRHLAGQERYAAHVTNLSRQMIADAAKIDDLAVLIQEWNTQRSRLNTPELSRAKSLHDALPQLKMRLNVIYGDHDSVAYPYIAERRKLYRQLCPDANFRFIAGAGHWVPYEAAHEFNIMLLDLLRRQ